MSTGHRYGLDLESDLKTLYGDDYAIINEERYELWNKLSQNNIPFIIKAILQNPIPINQKYYVEWLDCIRDYENDISKNGMVVVEKVKDFIIKYHLDRGRDKYE